MCVCVSVSKREIVGCKVEETVNAICRCVVFFGVVVFCVCVCVLLLLLFFYIFVGLFMIHSRHICGSGSSQEISVIAKE